MKFTVIIPIYNAENYLEDSIQSVVNQTLGFQDNVKLILINDGSTDCSEKIALKYQRKYPRNIIYKYIENSGPSKARNKGIELIPSNTHYTTFLDSDDMLEKNALERVKIFFEEHPSIHIAVLPVFYFEKVTGPIKLNNRFSNNRTVVDIHEEYTLPHFYIGGAFIHNKYLVNNKWRFNENIGFWEDALFINKLIILEGQYGLVHKTKYWYRKRNSEDSLVDISWLKKDRYTKLIKDGYHHLINYSLTIHKSIIPYVQYLIVYHLKLFAFQRNSNILLKVLSKPEKEEFIKSVKTLLNLIDDKYIHEQNTKNIHKEFFLYLKTGKFMTIEDINSIDKVKAIKITNKKIIGLKLFLEGYFYDDNYSLKSMDKIFIQSPFGRFYAKQKRLEKKISIWGITVRNLNSAGFTFKLPILVLLWFQFGLETKNTVKYIRKINLFKKVSKRFYFFLRG